MREKNICIIDGYNVIHKINALRNLLSSGKPLDAREGLLRYCAEWWRNRRDVHCFYVVFDGDSSVLPNAVSPSSEIVVIFTKTKQTADEKIIQLLEEYNKNFRYIVVSADQFVVQNAKKRGATIMHPSEFYSVLSRSKHRKPSADDKFSGDKNHLTPAEEKDITDDLRKIWLSRNE